jgi:hypothetical protein
LTFGDEVIVAALSDSDAPRTTEAFWQLLPLESRVSHAKVAGPELMFTTPLHEEIEAPIKEQSNGNICYYPLRQTVCVFYGDLPGAGYVTPLATVVENLEGLARAGAAAWQEQGASVLIERVEEAA